jgi:hypothetical protein
MRGLAGRSALNAQAVELPHSAAHVTRSHPEGHPMIRSSLLSLPILCALLLGANACQEGSAPGSGAGGEGGGPTFRDPLYAMMVQVYSVDGEDRTVYAYLTHSLELGDIDLASAREFPGVANLVPLDGRLLVSSGLEPSITEFDISDDLEWSEGRTVGFGTYAEDANLFGHHFLDDSTAQMPFDLTSRVIWDPSRMRIEGTREDSSIELMQGNDLFLDNAGNRNSVVFEEEVQQPFVYVTEDWFRLGPESVIAFYDRETNEETHTLTIPCPGLAVATRDEQGYTYYGSWTSPITLALFGEGPLPCNARLNPAGELDEEWTTDFTDWTDGRYVNNFRYIGGGRAIGNVLHHELIDADWDAGYDPDVEELIWYGGFWRFWLFDLEAGTAHPVEGVDAEVGESAQFAVLDGRTFVFLGYDDWARTKIYEIDEDGMAVEHADTAGDVFKWVRVR